MQLIFAQSVAAGFIPIKTWQQRASLPFKRGVLERKVYNNYDITFFSVLTFAKPECDIVLQPSLLCQPGGVAQSVTETSLTADPGVASLIPSWSHTFVELDREIISRVILLSSAESFKKGCCQLQTKVCAKSAG